MEINYELSINKEQFYQTLKMVGCDESKINKLWIKYCNAFKYKVSPRKYTGTRYKGELLKYIELSPMEDEVTLVTENYKKVFWCECEDRGADFVLCELQNENELNVSKY